MKTYIDKFNLQFDPSINHTTSVFENIDTKLINSILAIIDKRTFNGGCAIKYKNKWYCAYRYDHKMNYIKGTRCLVIETFDGKLLCNVDDELSILYELSIHEKISKEFGFEQPKKKRKETIFPH